MAVDKLVDSAKLDACCTAEANAIRAKSGGAAQLAYDWQNNKGFADAIAAIPSGGGKTFTKLVDITVNEPTSEIAVTVTEQIANCREFYVKHNNVQLSVADWVSVVFNNCLIYFNSKSTTHPGAIGRICLPLSGTHSIDGASVDDMLALLNLATLSSSDVKKFPSTVNSIKITTYTGGSITINTGHFQIWGMV